VSNFFSILYKLLAVALLLALSIIFAVILFAPGVCSNMVAWLETDGSSSALILGSLFTILITGQIITNLHLFSPREITVHRGIFKATITEGVFTQLVQKLWNEYFRRTDLSVQATLKKNGLYITGEVPEGISDSEGLSSFVAKKLLQLTGFFGTITIESSTRKTGPSISLPQ
jgi:hypothetical protein